MKVWVNVECLLDLSTVGEMVGQGLVMVDLENQVDFSWLIVLSIQLYVKIVTKNQ
jgi:hypothetical protein